MGLEPDPLPKRERQHAGTAARSQDPV